MKMKRILSILLVLVCVGSFFTQPGDVTAKATTITIVTGNPTNVYISVDNYEDITCVFEFSNPSAFYSTGEIKIGRTAGITTSDGVLYTWLRVQCGNATAGTGLYHPTDAAFFGWVVNVHKVFPLGIQTPPDFAPVEAVPVTTLPPEDPDCRIGNFLIYYTINGGITVYRERAGYGQEALKATLQQLAPPDEGITANRFITGVSFDDDIDVYIQINQIKRQDNSVEYQTNVDGEACNVGPQIKAYRSS